MGLYLSVTTASSDLTSGVFARAVTRLAATVARLEREGLVPASPSLDLTLMLPGKYEKPNFSGMRMGGFTAADEILYFQAAVPERLLASELADTYLALLLQDMIDNAAELFCSTSVRFDETPWRLLLARLASPAGEAARASHLRVL